MKTEASDEKRQHVALIKEILKSPGFKDVPLRSALLRYLFKKKAKRVSGEEIWLTVLNGSKDRVWDDIRVRERCLNLRKALDDYFANRQTGWTCKLPPAEPDAGYQLCFENRGSADRPTNLFWLPHSQPGRRIVVFFDELLFYVDRKKEMAFRYWDLDGETRQTALAELKAKGQEYGGADVEPVYILAVSNGVAHYEWIERWFDREGMTRVERRTCRNMDSSSVADVSPIILCGLTRCEFARDVMKSAEYLDFQIWGGERGYSTIRVRGGKKWSEHQEDPNGKIFVLVTRMPNPFGKGCMTLVNAGHNAAIEHTLRALTDDTQLGGFLGEAGWSLEAELPEAFQMLFTLERGRVRRETSIGNLKLENSRSYQNLT